MYLFAVRNDRTGGYLFQLRDGTYTFTNGLNNAQFFKTMEDAFRTIGRLMDQEVLSVSESEYSVVKIKLTVVPFSS